LWCITSSVHTVCSGCVLDVHDSPCLEDKPKNVGRRFLGVLIALMTVQRSTTTEPSITVVTATAAVSSKRTWPPEYTKTSTTVTC